MSKNNSRFVCVAISVVAAVVFIAVAGLLFKEGWLAVLLFDRDAIRYPFTIQNLMWVVFFIGCGELWLSFRKIDVEMQQSKMQLLPEEDSVMLRSDDLGEIYKRANQAEAYKACYLQRMISRTILQFQSSHSVSQANTLLNSSLELFQHEIDLSYSLLRYVVWLIPTLGFIGTVVGISSALTNSGILARTHGKDLIDHSDQLLVGLTTDIGVAFDTTLLALILSAILVFLLHISQERHEMSLNHSGQYCLDNLINRLYEK